MIKFLTLTSAGVLFATLLFGCSQEPPPPSLTRSDLVLRLFQSMEQQDYHAALEQCGKLRALGNFTSSFVDIEDAIRYNLAVRAAQQHLDANDLAAAAAALEAAIAQSLTNQRLNSQLDEVNKLLAIERELKVARNTAADAATRRKAIDSLDILLRTYPPGAILHPELERLQQQLEPTTAP